jgi:hypothetical protein
LLSPILGLGLPALLKETRAGVGAMQERQPSQATCRLAASKCCHRQGQNELLGTVSIVVQAAGLSRAAETEELNMTRTIWLGVLTLLTAVTVASIGDVC